MSPSFPFLQLPIELQDRVLEYYFNSQYDLRITQHVIGGFANAEVGHHKVYAAGSSEHLSVLRMSRDLYKQARRALHNSFSGYLDLSSVQYSSKFSLAGQRMPIPTYMPRDLIKTINLGKIEWREALCLPTFDGMVNLELIKFVSSTIGKKSQTFQDLSRLIDHDDFVKLFYEGDLDKYFLEIAASRAKRVWKDQSPSNESGIRWEVQLVGDSCPMVESGYLTMLITFTSLEDIMVTTRKVIDAQSLLRECEVCTPDCVYFRERRGNYCHDCTAATVVPATNHTMILSNSAMAQASTRLWVHQVRA